MRTNELCDNLAAPRFRRARRPHLQIYLFLLLLPGLPLASSSGDDSFKTSYANGLTALEHERWPEAAKWFRKAIKAKSKAGGKVPTSSGKQYYVPYHHLAFSLYSDDALEEAEQYWEISEEQKVLKKRMPRDYKLAQQYRVEIASRLEEINSHSPPLAEPPKEYLQELEQRVSRHLQRAIQQMDNLSTPDMLSILDNDFALAKQKEAGRQKLQKAQQTFDNYGDSVDQLSEALTLAREASKELSPVILQATIKLNQQ